MGQQANNFHIIIIIPGVVSITISICGFTMYLNRVFRIEWGKKIKWKRMNERKVYQHVDINLFLYFFFVWFVSSLYLSKFMSILFPSSGITLTSDQHFIGFSLSRESAFHFFFSIYIRASKAQKKCEKKWSKCVIQCVIDVKR